MKLKNRITLLLAVAAVALIAVNALVLLAEDRRAPEIAFAQGELTYNSSLSEEQLLEGVTASDNRDGDVTDSLRIGEILPSADKSQVTVVYTAKDSSNNIAQLSRVLPVEGAVSEGALQNHATGTDTEGQEATTPTPTPTPAATQEPVVTEEAGDPNEAGRLENEAAIAALAPEAPRMYLSQYAVTIPAGSDFNALGYVEDITDDADSRDDLYRQIQISGEADTQTPGVYELYFYVNDSDGNTSNQARLSVTVQ